MIQSLLVRFSSVRGLVATWLLWVAVFFSVQTVASAQGPFEPEKHANYVCTWTQGGPCSADLGCIGNSGPCGTSYYLSGYAENLTFSWCGRPYPSYYCLLDGNQTPWQKCWKIQWWSDTGCQGDKVCDVLYGEFPPCRQEPMSST